MVKKQKDNDTVELPDKIVISDTNQLQEIYKNAFDNTNDVIENTKDLEIGKLVLAMIKNPEFLNSTTNLSLDEITDLADAYYLNLIFDSDLIDEYTSRYQMLKRSETKEPENMLKILSELAGKQLNIPEQSTFGKIIGRMRG